MLKHLFMPVALASVMAAGGNAMAADVPVDGFTPEEKAVIKLLHEFQVCVENRSPAYDEAIGVYHIQRHQIYKKYRGIINGMTEDERHAALQKLLLEQNLGRTEAEAENTLSQMDSVERFVILRQKLTEPEMKKLKRPIHPDESCAKELNIYEDRGNAKLEELSTKYGDAVLEAELAKLRQAGIARDFNSLSMEDRHAYRQCTNEETRKDHEALIQQLRNGAVLPGTENLPEDKKNWRGMVNVLADLQIGMITCGQQMNIQPETLPLIRVQ